MLHGLAELALFRGLGLDPLTPVWTSSARRDLGKYNYGDIAGCHAPGQRTFVVVTGFEALTTRNQRDHD